MTCSACSSAIEVALAAMPAVRAATVALLQNRGEVVFDHSAIEVRGQQENGRNDDGMTLQ